ncbi:MAG: glycosyltransferase, partial [Planctomycetota bacterium]
MTRLRDLDDISTDTGTALAEPANAAQAAAHEQAALSVEAAPAGLGNATPTDWTPSKQARGRSRAEQSTAVGRIRRDGKFFRVCAPAGEVGAKFFPKGFTYGPFEPNSAGEPLPERDDVRRDFEQIASAGGTVVRVYHTPPTWLLDLAAAFDLRVMVDVAWAKNLVFTDDRRVMAEARRSVRRAAQACGNHPAVFTISVANEIPAEVVRYAGAEKVEAFLDDLIKVGKRHAPDCLFTFANFPSTEFLRPRRVDFLTFNVYLHEEQAFRNYLGRLQSLAGELPLVLGEYGIDTIREASPHEQAERLEGHLRAVFDEGLAGAIVFSFTDDWFVHGYQMAGEWNFGVTHGDRDADGVRRVKPALEAVGRVFAQAPHTAQIATGLPLWDELPKVSVIVCSYNGASTVESCLASMQRLNYPDYEVIFVDDGSTDHTQDILRNFKSVRNIVQTNHGLSFARNVGMRAARGEIIVYTDSDCEADEDWLYYTVLNLLRTGHIGMGGPNLIPDEGSAVAECVGLSPGGPTHVMIDDRTAEHVPGCNMAFWQHAALEINGFDTQYTKAGDDVDFIWRLQD